MAYIKNYDQLASNHNRKVVLDLAEVAFSSIAPKEVFKTNFNLKGDTLTIQDHKYDLSTFERVFLIGFGKGSAGNCKMVEEHLGDKLTEGYVIDVVEDEHFKKVEYTKGTHPLPSQENFTFTANVIERLEGATEKDLVIIVTCGGGSVLFEKPNTLTLERMTEVNKALLQSGANITEMNVIRKALSRVKGGGLAKILFPATVVNLIYSDVPGNDLSVIASGPLVKNHATIKDVKKIFEKYNLAEKAKLKMEDFVETPTDAKYFKKISNILMLSNLTALNAMEKKSRELGYEVYVMTDRLQGDAKTLGEQLINETPHGHILLAGGESTVKVKGKGVGGRNQALVLSALKFIEGDTVIASFGTDGWDFTTFAGAIGDKDSLKKVKEMDIKVQEYINDDNSTRFFEKEGDGIETGHLDSNVSDLYIVLRK